jgi:hypothetical protein
MNWKERSAKAHAAFRPSNQHWALDVTRLRNDLFPNAKGKIPKHMDDSFSVEVFNTKGVSLGRLGIRVIPSNSVGKKQCRGGRGHRMFVQCPGCVGCARMIPVGRLHQHYAYAHPPQPFIGL